MSVHGESGRCVVVTGATGFLGGELLARLLQHERRNVVCLVRAAGDVDAGRRGRNALAQALGRKPRHDELRRLRWVRGDVRQPALGLTRRTHSQLARSVDEIFHCAASTRFDLPIDEARGANLVGTRSLLALAREALGYGRFRRFHHVSTAYVAGVFDGCRDASRACTDGRRFRNSYERSKAEAERCLIESADVPFTIFRPSIIVGNSRSGRTTSWNVVYYPMKLMAAGVLPNVPGDPDGRLDCVPVDYVAAGMLAFADREDTAGGIFHLTAGAAALTCREVIEFTYREIAALRHAPTTVGTRLVSPFRWWFLKQWLLWFGGSRAASVIQKFDQYEPYTRVRGIFDNRMETALLARSGVYLPPAAEFFPRAIRYALRTDFGRRALESPRDDATHMSTESFGTSAASARAASARSSSAVS